MDSKNLFSVWYEPTDVKKASKPFQSNRWQSLKFVSPNFNELKAISEAVGLAVNEKLHIAGSDVDALLEECVTLGRQLATFGTTVVITMGRLGVMIVRNGLADEPFFKNGKLIVDSQRQVMKARFYPVQCQNVLVNVSGAGDCFASGFIIAMLGGRTEVECVSCGLAASVQALQSISAVPQTLMQGSCTDAAYRELPQ